MAKIRTTGERDPYGTGNTKETVEENYTAGISTWWQALVMLTIPFIAGAFFIGSAFLFFKMIGY